MRQDSKVKEQIRKAKAEEKRLRKLERRRRKKREQQPEASKASINETSNK